MNAKLLIAVATVAALGMPASLHAQGVPGGAAQGAAEGGRVLGPPGAIVGGVVGGVAGGVAGILGIDQRPRFREYVVTQRTPSYRYADEVRVGAVLPESGVEYYEVPAEYGPRVQEYRYTVVNERPVLVEPRTRRIIEVID